MNQVWRVAALTGAALLVAGTPVDARGAAQDAPAVRNPEPATAARGQAPRGARRGAPPEVEGMTPAEVERLFDRYVLGQARAALMLTPDQMVSFAPRFDELQATRRRVQRDRQRLLNELAAVSRGARADEAAVGERLQALEALRVSSDTALRDAVAGVDEVLTVPQRARFRVFERRMERQKLELVARARRAARGAAPAP